MYTYHYDPQRNFTSRPTKYVLVEVNGVLTHIPAYTAADYHLPDTETNSPKPGETPEQTARRKAREQMRDRIRAQKAREEQAAELREMERQRQLAEAASVASPHGNGLALRDSSSPSSSTTDAAISPPSASSSCAHSPCECSSFVPSPPWPTNFDFVTYQPPLASDASMSPASLYSPSSTSSSPSTAQPYSYFYSSSPTSPTASSYLPWAVSPDSGPQLHQHTGQLQMSQFPFQQPPLTIDTNYSSPQPQIFNSVTSSSLSAALCFPDASGSFTPQSTAAPLALSPSESPPGQYAPSSSQAPDFVDPPSSPDSSPSSLTPTPTPTTAMMMTGATSINEATREPTTSKPQPSGTSSSSSSATSTSVSATLGSASSHYHLPRIHPRQLAMSSPGPDGGKSNNKGSSSSSSTSKGGGDSGSSSSLSSDKNGNTRQSSRSKVTRTACRFCRGRKIACGLPPPGGDGHTCNQCLRRSLTCVYPEENSRGLRHRRPPVVRDPPVKIGRPPKVLIAAMESRLPDGEMSSEPMIIMEDVARNSSGTATISRR